MTNTCKRQYLRILKQNKPIFTDLNKTTLSILSQIYFGMTTKQTCCALKPSVVKETPYKPLIEYVNQTQNRSLILIYLDRGQAQCRYTQTYIDEYGSSHDKYCT